MSDQSERLHLEGLDEATERERWEEHHDAAALTEQIAELLFQHQISKADSNWYGCTCGTPLAWNGVTNTQSHRAHLAGVLAARLADSRPVVSEGAIRAAAEAMRANGVIQAHSNARLALTAALPHMGDGKGEADLRDRINALADEWDAAARDFTDQAEGMSGDRAAKHYAVASKYALHAQRVRALLDPLRLSPTGDDSE